MAVTGPSSWENPRLGRRILTGGIALLLRQAIVRGIQVVGSVLLARLLEPEVFGVFAISLFVVQLFSLLGDLGLAASLIQQAAEPSESQKRAAFTLQMVLFSGAAIGVAALSPVIVEIFGLGSDIIPLLPLIALTLPINGLRTLPALSLERRLDFRRLAGAEIAQGAVFYVLAVAMAAAGAGVWSFGVAAVVSSAANTLLVNVMAPWRPGFRWDPTMVRQLLRFGVPYQGVTAASFVKDAVNPVFVGLTVGPVAVGYVTWALQVTTYPLVFVTILSRLLFSAFARLADRGDRLAMLYQAAVRWGTFLSVGIATPFLLDVTYWVGLIFGPQWLPAAWLLYLTAPGILVAAAAAPGLALMNAHGRSREAFGFAVLWMCSTWLLTVPAVAALGWPGFGVANFAVVVGTAPLFFYRASRIADGRVVPAMATVCLAVAAAGLVAWPVLHAGATVPLVGHLLLALLETAVFALAWSAMNVRQVRMDVRAARAAWAP